MSQAESIYDICLAKLRMNHNNIDPYLLMKIMYLERTVSTNIALGQKGELPNVPPMVEIEIKFKEGTDTEKVIYEMQSRGIPAMHHGKEIFMKSTMMYFVISVLGVLIFVGLTAYDTQKIKNMYLASDSGEIMGKKAVMGALTLYLDFINLFIMLLRLFGQRR